MSQAFSIRRTIILTCVYALICLLPALLGVVICLAGQPGCITQPNAFIAPFLGPWSQTLPPNPHYVNTWSPKFTMFAHLLAAILAFSIIGSNFAPSRALRYPATVIAIISLTLWSLCGLVKVLSQLA